MIWIKFNYLKEDMNNSTNDKYLSINKYESRREFETIFDNFFLLKNQLIKNLKISIVKIWSI